MRGVERGEASARHGQRRRSFCARQRLSQDPQLAEELGDFFDESREERFFVKNSSASRATERDAILSIGYGKNTRGDLPYRFGPRLMEGGERRVNVAVTRARNRVTLVSSFLHLTMDPSARTPKV